MYEQEVSMSTAINVDIRSIVSLNESSVMNIRGNISLNGISSSSISWYTEYQ